MSITRPQNLRNVAIIAHVDHGKTTLVDALFRQTGTVRSNEALPERAMDSIDLERERGITIEAKHTAITHRGVRINIIDTPGHADFGGEVERTLVMADGALLLVDAAEGPLPQTRFVLKHALGLGLPIILVINKIDRDDARPEEVVSEVFDLFCDLDASDAQADFQTLYTIAPQGRCRREPDGEDSDLTPLMDTILERVPPPRVDVDGPLQFLVTNLGYDDYVGRLAIGKLMRGRLHSGASVARVAQGGHTPARVSAIYGYEGLKRVSRNQVGAGDVVALAGLENIEIGDTITDPEHPDGLERIRVEEPTIRIGFHVNTSPFAGREGKYVTSRQLAERLHKEVLRNIALRVETTAEPDTFVVLGRGELMIAVLAETMRREGYEMALGSPEVVTREIDGVRCEPVERVVVDVPDEHVGGVTSSLGERQGRMVEMSAVDVGRQRLEFVVPSRGLLGYRTRFLTETRGTGLLNTLFEGWEPAGTALMRRKGGALVADRAGRTTPYALFHLQARGELCVGPGVQVYEGMIVGEHNRASDLDVNVTREKKLTNIRAAGRDDNVVLSPARQHTIESSLEFIDLDELVEVTPAAIRLRKKILTCGRRPKRGDF